MEQISIPRRFSRPVRCSCYNLPMTFKNDLAAYRARWAAVEAFHQDELRTATMELRWRQLNAAYGLARALGILRPDPSEAEVWEKWAKIKEKMASQSHQT